MFEKPSSTESSDYWFDWAAFICFVAGVFFVIAIARSNLGVYNSDEAIAGLMARDVLDGKFEAFFWSQDYGGTVAVFLLALVTFVFGADLAMRLTPLIELMLIALLSFLLFRRVVPTSLARLGGGLTMCASAAWIWSVSRPMLFYNSTLIAGLLLLFLATNTTSKPRVRETAWVGLVAGIGWWTSPQFLIFLGASVMFIDRRLLATTKKIVLLLLSFILGSLPWWWSNIETGFDSIIERPPGQGTVLNHLHTQFVTGFPVISGLREPFTLKWIPLSLISISLVVILGISYFRRSRRGPRLRYLPSVGLSFFVAFTAVIPTGWFVGGGRYYVFAVPFLILGLLLLFDNARRYRIGQLISLCFVFLVIFNTARSLSAVKEHQFGPTNLDEVSESLEKGPSNMSTETTGARTSWLSKTRD